MLRLADDERRPCQPDEYLFQEFIEPRDLNAISRHRHTMAIARATRIIIAAALVTPASISKQTAL